jgi:amino acid transporter
MATKLSENKTSSPQKSITLSGAIFIGIGAMVGAGIFALFGEAGTIAGSAVWVSFFAAGVIALLQGYSFAKLGARYPSAGGLISWIVRGYGSGAFTGGMVMLGYFSMIISNAMVAVSFGNYASRLFMGDEVAPIWAKVFAAAILIVLTYINSIGTAKMAKAQAAIVTIVLVVLGGFAIALLLTMDPTMLAPSTYPPMNYILASVALTFFAYLGFGAIAFTGGDLENPTKNLPKAMYISLILTMVLYVALAIGVFGTLTVNEVIESADTALATAALPIFGAVGYTLISIAAILATSSTVNSQLYASIGATYTMAADGHLPPVFGQKRERRPAGTKGLVITALLMMTLALLFDVSAIASVGSAVALLLFALVTIAHLRMVKETKASKLVLYLTLLSTALAFLLFCWYTLQTEPNIFTFLIATIILAWVVEGIWRRISHRDLKVE